MRVIAKGRELRDERDFFSCVPLFYDTTSKFESERDGKRRKIEIERKRHKGSNSAGDPPLPIPNREVKPGRANGTVQAGE